MAIMQSYIELYSMHSRTKRPLILMVGEGLSFLIGRAPESDLKIIHTNIDKTAKNQKETAHVADESI